MTTPDVNVLTYLASCESWDELEQIRAAAITKQQEIRAAFMERASLMGLACTDENGKKRGKGRNSAAKETE